MKLVLAQMKHFKGTGAALGAFIDLAERAGAEVVLPVAAQAWPSIEIVVTSRQIEPYDIAAFRAVGIDPAAKRYLMLKSRVHWRAGLGAIARAVVECAGSGVCTSDYSQLDFRHLRRPVYPIDPM